MSAPRVMVFGLDGATFRIIEPLVAAGKLPHLAELLARGGHGPLLSTIPPHTAAAWPTFLTGMPPGAHGILNFDEATIGGYGAGARLVTSAAVAGRTFLDVASKVGLRVAAIRVPMTFPAWPVHGILVSGYPSPEQGDYVYPRELTRTIPGMRDPSEAPTPEARMSMLLDEVRRTTAISKQALAAGDIDLFAVVYQQSDVAHHWFWRYMDPQSPAYDPAEAVRLGSAIEQVYCAIDEGLGELLGYAGSETSVVVLSDHGGCLGASQQFHINAWLASLGLLSRRPLSLAARLYSLRRWLLPARARAKLKRIIGGMLTERAGAVTESFYFNLQDVDWSRTRAFRYAVTAEVEGIMLNVVGRQPWGRVAEGSEFAALRERLIEELATLRAPLDGQPLVRAIYRREEVFAGGHADHTPDLVVILHPSYRGGRELSGPLFSPVPLADLRHNFGGWHEPEGILIAAGPGIPARTIEGARLLDMAPTVLGLLGLSAPSWMQGTAIPDLQGAAGSRVALSPEAPPLVVAPTPEEAAGVGAASARSARLSPEEEQSVRERLRNLGYL
jgi:predicted AlkP superfamily phosphohydrolase/phosphomutase